MKVGMIGWRGMVGSVLVERMQQEDDFAGLEVCYFTTSQMGQDVPAALPAASHRQLMDAEDLRRLSQCDALVTCQGGDYTKRIYPQLRAAGWQGWWIDAASTLRLDPDAVIVLDPVNRSVIDARTASGTRTLVGGNCTVSLMLMAIAPLFQQGWVEWLSSMTYQAASGAGAAALKELAEQTHRVGAALAPVLADPASSALELDRVTVTQQRDPALPTNVLGAPLQANLIPWVDRLMPDGRSREEWKGDVETQRILGLDPEVPVDGLCVRVGAMRCHAQGLTIKLKQDVPLAEIESLLCGSHEWTNWVPNEPESTKRMLHPAAVSGSLQVAVGRVRKMRLGGQYLAAFTVGDQLLWGAAEPLRRALAIVRGRL